MGLFAMCYLGLGISLFPYVVPYRITLWEAASSPSAQTFLGVGTMFMLPLIFMYTFWSYYVFRGKVRGGHRVSLSMRARAQRLTSDCRFRCT